MQSAVACCVELQSATAHSLSPELCRIWAGDPSGTVLICLNALPLVSHQQNQPPPPSLPPIASPLVTSFPSHTFHSFFLCFHPPYSLLSSYILSFSHFFLFSSPSLHIFFSLVTSSPSSFLLIYFTLSLCFLSLVSPFFLTLSLSLHNQPILTVCLSL